MVGDYNTPKYRHVARERPDIKVMDPRWVDAVTSLWKNDDEIDCPALEKQYQLKTFERGCSLDPAEDGKLRERDTILLCLTGFGDKRDDIADMITANGGHYTGDLTRRVTHLVVNEPEGKKFAAAKTWNIHTITLNWLLRSIERGLMLEETKFDPTLSPEEQGVGAIIPKEPRRESLGKRSRSDGGTGALGGVRKLRKTTSMKVNPQGNNMWGDILGRADSKEHSFTGDQKQMGTAVNTISAPNNMPLQTNGIFARCIFTTHGFSRDRGAILKETIVSLGGHFAQTLKEMADSEATTWYLERILVVPQASQSETHPRLEFFSNVHTVTEFFIERCLHKKQFFHPIDHVLGQPFPAFPIEGFSKLRVCSATFNGIELSQVARSVTQLGALFDEHLRPSTSVLVCRSLEAMRPQKLDCALRWHIPIVTADWLWKCISTGYNVPPEDYIYSDVKTRYPKKPPSKPPSKPTETNTKPRHEIHTTSSEPRPIVKAARNISHPPLVGGMDMTAFDKSQKQPKPSLRTEDPKARDLKAVQMTVADGFTTKPNPTLTERSFSSLNKSPSPAKSPKRKPNISSFNPKDINDAITEMKGVTKSRSKSPPRSKPPISPDREGNQDVESADWETELRRKARAEERRALSTKITTLIHSTSEPPTLDTPSTTGLAGGSASFGTTKESGPRPRRRQILGRALSNASSAASLDGTPSHQNSFNPPAYSKLKSKSDRHDSADSKPENHTATNAEDGGGEADQDEGYMEEPSTQLEYCDPKAQQAREALMNKMLGDESRRKSGIPVDGAEIIGGLGQRTLRRR